MGKLLCDSTTTVAETTFQTPTSPIVHWRDDPKVTVDHSEQTLTISEQTTWEDVIGLEDQQRRHLQRLQSKGVLWKHPKNDESYPVVVFKLSHGGDVSADGNCLFTASQRAMVASEMDARELRRRTARRFVEDFGSVSGEEREAINNAIKHIEMAAESIYKERCMAVNDGPSWAKYMSISGSHDDEYDIITLQYTEEGLLYIDENRKGHAAAFGDDIAIECLATEFKREIYVVQAHGSDGMVDEENCVFFLPHRPRSEICEPPFFLFMKGTGWCGAGADHYEPLIAHPSSLLSQEKVAVVLGGH
ncbi:hypothetical protein D5086_000546 [Populus alba]|uniref:Uncharacterized protein n=1 Tax=Populus alba TaxID=43335 RepID=A0ACC4CW56_POPAL